MNKPILLFFILVLFALYDCKVQNIEQQKQILLDTPIEVLWDNFKVKYGKTYANVAEEQTHFGYFQQNIQLAIKINSENPLGLHGVTKFSDRNPELPIGEFAVPVGTFIPTMKKQQKSLQANLKRAAAFENERTPVKNQSGICGGGGYAFAAVAVIESMRAKSGDFKPLSEQSIIDCCLFGCDGCSGGGNYFAMSHISSIGIPTTSDYSFSGSRKACKWGVKKEVTVDTISIYDEITDAMDHIAETGPIMSVIYSGPELWSYVSGVFQPSNCPDSDPKHGVAIVGYDGNQTWTVKNSFGEDWGEAGYFHTPIGSNYCGIEHYAFIGVTVSNYHLTYTGITLFVLTLCFCIGSTVMVVRAFYRKRKSATNYIA